MCGSAFVNAYSVTIAQHQAIANAAVQKARYDKIQHVRSAAEKALRAVQALAAQYHHSHMAAMSGSCFPADSQRWLQLLCVSFCCGLTHLMPTEDTVLAWYDRFSPVSRPRSTLHRGSVSATKGSSKATPSARRSLAPRISASEELDFGVQVGPVF